MASAKNPTEGSKVTEMEKKTGVKSHEKEIELQAGGQGAASEADQEAQAMEKLKHYKEVEGGVVPKSQDDAIHAVTSARSHDAQPQKLHEEITPFKDDWGLDAEGERETGVKYSGREEKPVPNSPDPKLDDLAEERKKAGKGPEAVKKAVEEQEKNGSKL